MLEGVRRMGEYRTATVKEIRDWLNNPHTSSMSDAMKDHAWMNRHKPKIRAAKMCQACGAVSIIGSDRLRESNESKHGAYYCDKECAESDRGRVYRTSEEYQAKISARCQREGKRRAWETDVCAVTFCECKICHRSFVSKSKVEKTLCSGECVRVWENRQELIRRRKQQQPKETQCAECGVAFTTLVRTQFHRHYCSNECMNSFTRKQVAHTRRERERTAKRIETGCVSLKGQYAKFSGVCQLCGCKTKMLKQYAPHQATVDHIIPLSKGGLHVEGNLQLACHACNSIKCDKLHDSPQWHGGMASGVPADLATFAS
jgi:5-methylcytosine-specific restriction endonuclease McrA